MIVPGPRSDARRALVGLVAAVLLGSAAGCAHRPAPEEAPAREDAATDLGNVRLEAEAVTRAGIRTATVETAEVSAAIDASGRTLDPLPLVQDLHAAEAARATATLARAEYERVAKLHQDDQNASTRDLQSARAALDKAILDLADASARVTLAWGSAADRGAALADDLVAGRAALVRIDLPAGASMGAMPAAVAVAEIARPNRTYAARILSRAPAVDPLVQGDGLLAIVTDDPPRPGTALSALLPREAATAGVAVPASAVLWVEAQPAVYAEVSAGEFARRTITLGPRVDDRWVVTAGVAVGDRVVVAGAARLLSSELLRATPPTD